MAGFIKIPNEVTGCDWFKEPVTLYFYVRLLAKASLNGDTIDTSLAKLAAEFGLSIRQVRTCLMKLEATKQATKQATSQTTKVTLCNTATCKGVRQGERQAERQSERQTEYSPVPLSPSPQVSPAPLSNPASTPPLSPSLKKTADAVKEGLEGSVSRLYAAYPTKCPVSGRSTGKSSKDKAHLLKLLREEYTESALMAIIHRYLQNCTATQSYIKNFSTFLNNIPDYTEDTQPGSFAAAPQTQRQESTQPVSRFDVASGGFDF